MSVSSKITTTLFAVFVVIATVAIAVTSAFAKPYEISNKAFRSTYISSGLDVDVSASYQKDAGSEVFFVSSKGLIGEVSLLGKNEETLVADSFGVDYTTEERFVVLKYSFKNKENSTIKVNFADSSTSQNAQLKYLKRDNKFSNTEDSRAIISATGSTSPVTEFSVNSAQTVYYYVLVTIPNGTSSVLFANGFRWTISLA